MTTALTILLVLAMIGTLGTLFAGMLSITRSEGNPGRSNVLMRWRVMLQGAALLLFALLLMVMKR